jgi:hypothetical protein
MSQIQITQPTAGATFASRQRTNTTVEIQWTRPSSLASLPAVISLVQGSNVSDLAVREVIADNAPNNGSYTWTESWIQRQSSGCNYSIQIDVLDQRAYSDYFTLLDHLDEVPVNRTTCPGTRRPCGEGDDGDCE